MFLVEHAQEILDGTFVKQPKDADDNSVSGQEVDTIDTEISNTDETESTISPSEQDEL